LLFYIAASLDVFRLVSSHREGDQCKRTCEWVYSCIREHCMCVCLYTKCSGIRYIICL